MRNKKHLLINALSRFLLRIWILCFLLMIALATKVAWSSTLVPVGYQLEFGGGNGKMYSPGEQFLVLTLTLSRSSTGRPKKTSRKIYPSRRELKKMLENPQHVELKNLMLDTLLINERDLQQFLAEEDRNQPISLTAWRSFWGQTSAQDKLLLLEPSKISSSCLGHTEERENEEEKAIVTKIMTFHPILAQKNSQDQWERQILGRGTRQVLYHDQKLGSGKSGNSGNSGKSGKSIKRCQQSLDFKKFQEVPHLDYPTLLSRYFGASTKRVKKLAFDPDHQAVTNTSILESYSALRAELEGVIPGPITRGGKRIDFLDAFGRPWDVKTPPSLKGQLKMEEVIRSISKKLKTPYYNGDLKTFRPVFILLDTSFLNPEDKKLLTDMLKNSLSPEELKRIKEVCSPVPLFF